MVSRQIPSSCHNISYTCTRHFEIIFFARVSWRIGWGGFSAPLLFFFFLHSYCLCNVKATVWKGAFLFVAATVWVGLTYCKVIHSSSVHWGQQYLTAAITITPSLYICKDAPTAYTKVSASCPWLCLCPCHKDFFFHNCSLLHAENGSFPCTPASRSSSFSSVLWVMTSRWDKQDMQIADGFKVPIKSLEHFWQIGCVLKSNGHILSCWKDVWVFYVCAVLCLVRVCFKKWRKSKWFSCNVERFVSSLTVKRGKASFSHSTSSSEGVSVLEHGTVVSYLSLHFLPPSLHPLPPSLVKIAGARPRSDDKLCRLAASIAC